MIWKEWNGKKDVEEVGIRRMIKAPDIKDGMDDGRINKCFLPETVQTERIQCLPGPAWRGQRLWTGCV